MDQLIVEKLSCSRGAKSIFSNLSFKLNKGDSALIKGANASGKTSLLRIIAGYLDPTSGSSTYKKNDSVQDIQYIGQKHALKNNLSIQKNISLWELLYSKKVNHHNLLSSIGLDHLIDRDIDSLSDGQKRRLSLLRLFMSQASLWLLDESFVHLDEVWSKALGQFIFNHTSNGGSVIITSNIGLELKTDLTINLSDYNV
jgi:heme exporter protein A|tara:strand:- start:171 stop:767 length:597 start_codon:yes stop_codon:yes gene_type:complete